MTTKMRTLRDFRNPIGCLILLAAFAAAAGCSTAESPSGSATNMNHVLPSGSSVAGWLVLPSGGTHASTATLDYIDGGGSSGCTQCHGSDLSGGISNVSCFGNPAGCHHTPVANWATPAVHGATAKAAPGSSGFASCQICHGSNFSGGGAQVACGDCHGPAAPHPARPWRGPTFTHVSTNTSNAPVCAQCHFPGSPNNPANHPPTPAPAGTAPGCFNSTLCHGAAGAPHPVGNPAWVTTPPAAEPHGNDAKATPGTTTGFAYCQVCHGTGTTSPANFGGGSSGVSCYPCHGPSAPHAPAPWRASAGSTYNHTNADTANAPVCRQCHFPGSPNNPANHPPTPAPAGTAPGCFNSTLCHGTAGAPHPVGATWVATAPAAQPHANDAKAASGATTGFSYCQVCHGTGTNFSGGSSGISCYTCHGVSAPHAPSPWRASAGSTYTHTTTAETGNAAVCAFCHFPGSPNNPANHPPTPAPAGTAPGCFNSTLCHGAAGAPHPVPYNDSSHFTVTSATFPGSCSACHDVSAPTVKSGPVCQTCHVAASPLTSLNCTSCHANPPNGGAPAGAAYPNVAGAHSTHIALNSAGTPISCDTCHSGLGAGTLSHYNLAKSRVDPGDAAFSAGFLYTGITGTAVTFNNALATLSCSNVSCHGAQGTPNWRTGTTVCTSCHKSSSVAPAFYNDYTQTFITHTNHLPRVANIGGGCTTCHTTLPAGTHFGTLSDKAIASRAAAATINPAFGYPSPPPANRSQNSCDTGSLGGNCH